VESELYREAGEQNKKKNINCKQQSREPKKIRPVIENKIAGTDELKLYKRRKHK
jgi:hypothetical protein